MEVTVDDLKWWTHNMPQYAKYKQAVLDNSYVALSTISLKKSRGVKQDEDMSSITSFRSSSSKATSDVTMFSTKHSRRRAAERDLTRREVQSALKHGEMHTTHFGKRVVTADGVTVILDQQSPVVITTWKTSYQRHGQNVVTLTEIKEESSES
jgi:hypothetical protein